MADLRVFLWRDYLVACSLQVGSSIPIPSCYFYAVRDKILPSRSFMQINKAVCKNFCIASEIISTLEDTKWLFPLLWVTFNDTTIF